MSRESGENTSSTRAAAVEETPLSGVTDLSRTAFSAECRREVRTSPRAIYQTELCECAGLWVLSVGDEKNQELVIFGGVQRVNIFPTCFLSDPKLHREKLVYVRPGAGKGVGRWR